MSLKLNDIVGNIFHTDEKAKAEETQQTANLQQKANNVLGTTTNSQNNAYNPFLKKNGELFNPLLNYQKLLDNPRVSNVAKNYITQATGLTPTVTEVQQTVEQTASPEQTEEVSGVVPVQAEATGGYENSTKKTPVQSGTGNYAKSVGKRVANTSAYNNNAAKGQCVWYVRGRASEKLGKDPGAIGNANEMYYNAKADAKLSATTSNIKPNIIVSYGQGTSSAGAKYGHVIYIEDVVGDTVYYTEGGSGYYKNGTDGVIKTATREGILNGVNTSGSRMGSNVIGFIDLNKY